MGVPLVASRTSPTELAATLAERLNITVVGYVRPGSMNVYTHPWRIAGAAQHERCSVGCGAAPRVREARLETDERSGTQAP